MTANQTVQSHPASVDTYIRHGWHLVPIPNGTKGPRTHGWNYKENALNSQTDLPPGYGIGLAHAYSGTMALDIDNWDIASTVLRLLGIDIQMLYDANDAVVIDSGREGHGKLLYAMPQGLVLPSKKMMTTDGDGKGMNYLDFRCGTAGGLTMQDVLPPSIHPDTRQPYRWAGKGHWTRLPLIPEALLNLWQGMLTRDNERTISTGDVVNASWGEIRSAIETISADCSREEWINVGMALHWAGTQNNQIDQALQLWNEWSMTSASKYPGERAVLNQWNSFKTDKATTVKIGTLFHIAGQHGWCRPLPEVASLFSNNAISQIITPLDVIDGLRPKPPEMDITLWPEILQRRSMEVSESVGCDPIVPLFAGLGAICGVVDARTRLELMPGFKVPPVLWLMTIGAPADKKSPGSRPMLSPLKQIEADDRPRYAKELLEWEGKDAQYASAKKHFLEWSASPESMIDASQAPIVPEMPPPPTALKITVSDVTSQKLVRQAATRPRGLLCYLDEMNSWVRKIVDNHSSEDRSAWVSGYESEPYEMDRVGAGSVHCENMAVSIYGNIQPTVFRTNIKALSSDGLLQRFIPGILHGSKTRLGHPVPESLMSGEAWENTLRLTYALPPQTYRLSQESYDAYRDFQIWYEAAKQDERVLDASVEYMTAFGKLEGLTGRLILICHIIESPFSPTVNADIVRRITSLIRGYVIPAYRYALGELGGAVTDGLDHWTIDHIAHISGETQTVDLKTLKRSARRQLEGKTEWQKEQAVMDSMGVLETAGWVVQIESEIHKKKVTWAINPMLPTMFKEYREAVILAKQRHVDYIYRYAIAKGMDRKIVKGYESM